MKKHSEQLGKCKPISMKIVIIVLLIAIVAFPIVVNVLNLLPIKQATGVLFNTFYSHGQHLHAGLGKVSCRLC